jgi:pimeloyl-ACP methyl ester carboxylesterase
MQAKPDSFLKRRRWLIVVPAVFVVLIAAFVIWANTVPAPMPEALRALQGDEKVSIETNRWTVFRPAGQSSSTGFIFYPGGRVDYRSYAPALRELAAAGYLVVSVTMPLNLAVLAPERALDVQAAFPQIHRWVIGGHSLGGAMAARFAFRHPDRVQGLVLWASYPPGSADLSKNNIPAASISGTLDGLATPEKIEASRALLPPATQWVKIEGANHAQFGWYGDQPGDKPAVLARVEQQYRVVAATLALLRAVTGG